MIAELGPLTCHFSNRAPLRTCQPSREWPSLEITVLQPRGASLCRCELCVRCQVIETAEIASRRWFRGWCANSAKALANARVARHGSASNSTEAAAKTSLSQVMLSCLKPNLAPILSLRTQEAFVRIGSLKLCSDMLRLNIRHKFMPSEQN